MIGTVNATWLACLLLLFTGIIGCAVGYFGTLLTRKPWSIKVAAADGATAFAVAVIYGFIVAEILSSRGIWHDLAVHIILVGSGSVILKHLLQAAFRSKPRV